MAKTKRGCLGCSLPVAIIVLVLVLGLFLVGFIAGPVGKSLFGNALPSWLSVPEPEIELPASVLFHISGFPVTNTLITTWITMIFLVIFSIAAASKAKIIPGRLQNLFETLLGFVYNLCVDVAGEKNGRAFFPVVCTVFLFVGFNAWLGLIPGYNSLTIDTHRTGEDYASAPIVQLIGGGGNGASAIAIVENGSVVEISIVEHGEGYTSSPDVIIEGGGGRGARAEAEVVSGEVEDVKIASVTHVLRPANTDFNTPLAIAICAVLAVQIYGLKTLKFKYIQKFFNFGRIFKSFGYLAKGKVMDFITTLVTGVVEAFVGFLELLSELVIHIISFTFRLFGNMTAGEILLMMIGFLVSMLVPIIFYGLELLIGFIQAIIFSGLTLIFMTTAVAHHEEEESEHA
jgi:F-type H+-transporting ATPase subunit a